MVSYDPTVAGNIRKHERDIRKLGTAPLGPVSLGPGDHIRPEDSDAFRFDQSGAYSSHRGVLWNLSDLTGSFANSIEAHTNLLSEHDGRLDGHDSRLGAAEGRLDGHDSTLSSHNTRISNAQSRADAAHSNAATAQARADSAWTRAGTGIANADTAQARADSAHTRIDGLSYASPGDIATLSNQVQALRSQVHDWMQTARASNPDLPPPIPS